MYWLNNRADKLQYHKLTQNIVRGKLVFRYCRQYGKYDCTGSVNTSNRSSGRESLPLRSGTYHLKILLSNFTCHKSGVLNLQSMHKISSGRLQTNSSLNQLSSISSVQAFQPNTSDQVTTTTAWFYFWWSVRMQNTIWWTWGAAIDWVTDSSVAGHWKFIYL